MFADVGFVICLVSQCPTAAVCSVILQQLLGDVQYLVFPRILQGTDERPMAAHGVSADGHPVGVGGEVGVDQFGELRDGQTWIS